ncbi:MAG: gliding motility-associated C-terminal domain-containing protein [Bacteroidia bacterium]|nr:gliding motility-associated C-terminal domain-containing protein [Bacteroidia bacterium]
MSTFNIEIIAEDTVICQGESTKLTAFCTSSQYGTQYYMWNTGEITSEISVMPDNNSSYVVVAADNCLIPDTAVIYIDVLPAPVIDIRADRINGCAPVLVKFSNIHQDNMIYEWNFDDIPSGQNNTSQLQNPEHLFENSGNYDITLSVTSLENDCQNKHTFNNYIRVFANPEADFIISSEVTSLFDAEVSFFDLSADNVTFWSWSFGDGGYSYYQNPSHIYKTADTFTVNLVVSTSEYCHDTLSKTVIIKPEHTLYWPTAFLPKPGDANDDNAYFTPIGTNVGDCDDCYKLYIYDRWGQKVFETKEFYGNNPSDNNRWNGRYYNKGQMVPVGVYTWYIEYKDVNNISHHNTGAITIIR